MQPERYYQIKAGFTGFRQQRSGCVYYYRRITNKAEVPGTPYRMSGTLKFSCSAYQERASDAFADSCASIAPDRNFGLLVIMI